MFTPVNITPLPRRGSALTLTIRIILVAAVAMALLATLAAYPSGSWRDAGSDTQGAPLPSTLQTEQTSLVAQPSEANNSSKDSPPSVPSGRGLPRYLPGRGDISGPESEAPATPTPIPPTPTPVPPTPTPASSPVALSDLESQMWEAINGERANAGLLPLAIDERLVVLARERSNDMITRGYFSHTTPEGKMVFDFLDARGIYSPYAGENLARTNGEATQAVQLTVSGFMNSGTHRKTVLNSHYTHLGIGEATSPDGMRYFTLVLIGT